VLGVEPEAAAHCGHRRGPRRRLLATCEVAVGEVEVEDPSDPGGGERTGEEAGPAIHAMPSHLPRANMRVNDQWIASWEILPRHMPNFLEFDFFSFAKKTKDSK
jgi:hypothetical protein